MPQHFPEDLVLQETADRNNFQGRYVLRHPWTGNEDCPATEEYRRQLIRRNEQEAQQLADLTGWDIADIRTQMNLRGTGAQWERRQDMVGENLEQVIENPTRSAISLTP